MPRKFYMINWESYCATLWTYITLLYSEIDNVYNLSLEDCAKQIKHRWVQQKIYQTRASKQKLKANLLILTKLSKKWQMTGQQSNNTKIVVEWTLEDGCKVPNMALEIRCFAFRAKHFDKSKCSKFAIKIDFFSEITTCYNFSNIK